MPLLSFDSAIAGVASEAGRKCIVVNTYSEFLSRNRAAPEHARPGANVVLCTDDVAIGDYVRGTYFSPGGWRALVGIDGDTLPIASGKVAEGLASLRIRLSQSDRERSACVMCMHAAPECACARCWSGVCRTCLAQQQLRVANPCAYQCPTCRTLHDVEALIRSIVCTTNTTRMTSMSAIRRTMETMGVQRTQISMEATFGNKAVLGSRTFAAVMTPSGRIAFQSEDRRLIKTLLNLQSTIFAVGEVPTCGSDERDMWRGRAFVVGNNHLVSEVEDAFALYATKMRAVASSARRRDI